MRGRLVRRRGLHAPVRLHQNEPRGIVTLLHDVEARDAGLRTSRLMAATPYQILTFIGRGTSARDYHCLKAALALP